METWRISRRDHRSREQASEHLRARPQGFPYLFVCRLAFKIAGQQNTERKKGLRNEEITIFTGCGFGAVDRLFEAGGYVLTTGEHE